MVTPLILAAKYQRWDVLARLLRKKAKTSAKDCLERSALFYASRIGHLASVKRLLKAGSPPNDGSLHEAARGLHADVVESLIKSGHEVDFKRTNKYHGHQTALHEMLLKCEGGTGQIEETIRKFQVAERMLADEDFFVALQNPFQSPQSLALVKALLRTGMSEMLRKGNLIMKVTVHQSVWYYSPTIYLEHGLAGLTMELRESLSTYLRESGGTDQFSARQDMRQPVGYIAVEKVVKAEAARLSADISARIAARESLFKTIPSSRQKETIQREAEQEIKQENKQYAIDEQKALKQLQLQAKDKRIYIEREELNERQKRNDLEVIRLQKQQIINQKIQQGLAASRREYHVKDLLHRRRTSFLQGVDTFTEKDQKLAGWVV
jgi:hypothetical protein